MKFTHRSQSVMVRVNPSDRWSVLVPVKRSTWALTIGKLIFTASQQATPIIPEAFREPPKKSETAQSLKG